METLAFKGRRPTHPGAVLREMGLPDFSRSKCELWTWIPALELV